MSGIVGLYELQGGPCSPARSTRMLDALAHRGPDGQQLWQKGALALGHAALHTTPEARHEEWPLVNPDGTCVLVADARIDNRDELIAALRPRLNEDAVVTDAMLILAAYEEWGRDCAHRLIGDFSFALWDEKREHLFCARDAFGVRPFYYVFEAGRRFAFASEIKALLEIENVGSERNESRIADYLAGICTTVTDTIYADVFRLPPAHYAIVTADECHVERYWSLDPDREIRYASDAEYDAAFRRLFDEAVRCRLRSPRPVGALLSGGLDSSAIVATAREMKANDASLHTFSTIFDEHPSCDERPYIEAVTRQGGVSAHVMTGDDVSPVELLDSLEQAYDQPVAGLNVGLSWAQYSEVRAQGIRVLLDGHGGDEVVSHGDGRLFELAQAGHWGTLARELFQLRRTERIGSVSALFWGYVRGVGLAPWLQRHPRLAGLWGRLEQAWGWISPDGGNRREHASTSRSWEDLEFLTTAFRERTDIDDRYREKQRQGRRAVPERVRHGRVLREPIQVQAFEELGAIGAAHGIEPRYPFWDRRLVEFCLALPADQKLRRGWGRFVLRNAMTGRLPEEIRWRAAKTNFFPFLASTLTREKEPLHTLLFSPLSGGKEYVADKELVDLWHVCTDTESDMVSPDALFTLWSITVLQHWMQGREKTGREHHIVSACDSSP